MQLDPFPFRESVIEASPFVWATLFRVHVSPASIKDLRPLTRALPMRAGQIERIASPKRFRPCLTPPSFTRTRSPAFLRPPYKDRANTHEVVLLDRTDSIDVHAANERSDQTADDDVGD